MEDDELLREYAEHHSEAAFAELVSRHVSLVYSTARRMVGEAHLAHDVAQQVFIDLARKPWAVRHPAALAGWLYCATRYTAGQTLRTERRRRSRETEAMNRAILENETPASAWDAIGPELDEAMRQLKPVELNAIILRFFEDKSLHDTGRALNLSENAAQKRVACALEKMRRHFARRGVVVSAALLAGAISAHAVQTAPVGLAATFSGSALTGAGNASFFTSFCKTLYLAMKTKTIVTAVVFVAAAIPLYLQHQKIAELQSRLDARQSGAARAVPAGHGNAPAVAGMDVPLTIADPVSELNRILKLSSSVEIMRELSRVLSSIQPGQFPALLAAFAKSPHTSSFSLIEPILISAWAEHDPEAAITWTHNLPKTSVEERTADILVALRTWAMANPAAAADYAMKYTPNSPAEDAAFRAIVDGVIQDWSFTNPQAAWDWVQTLNEGGAKQNAERTIITNLARLNLQGAFNAAASLPDDGANGIRIKILNNVLYSWGEQDPAKVVSNLDGLTGIAKRSGYATVAAAWYKHDPVAAMQWINSWNNLSVRDGAMRQLVNGQLNGGAANAFRFALALQDDNVRQTSLVTVVQAWVKQDPEAAASAIQSANLTDQDKAALLNTVQAQMQQR